MPDGPTSGSDGVSVAKHGSTDPSAGQYVLGCEKLNRTIGNMAAAQCHYAPIAWQLLHAGQTDLDDHQGWPSINHWTTFDSGKAVALDTVCEPLPGVAAASPPRARRRVARDEQRPDLPHRPHPQHRLSGTQ